VAQAAVRKLLNERPEWWQYFLQPALFYGDIALNVAADLLIADSERRCAAVLRRGAFAIERAPFRRSGTVESCASSMNS